MRGHTTILGDLPALQRCLAQYRETRSVSCALHITCLRIHGRNHNTEQGAVLTSPDSVDPEKGELGEQLRSVKVQACHCFMDAVLVRHDMQAPVLSHIALHASTFTCRHDVAGKACSQPSTHAATVSRWYCHGLNALLLVSRGWHLLWQEVPLKCKLGCDPPA